MKRIISLLYCFLLIMLNVKADDYNFSRLDKITAFAYSNNGNLIAAAEIAGNINIYDASTLEKIKTFNGKVLVTSQIIFSPDDRCVAVASYGIQVFEIETGNVLFEYLPGIGDHSRKIYSISYGNYAFFIIFPHVSLRPTVLLNTGFPFDSESRVKYPRRSN